MHMHIIRVIIYMHALPIIILMYIYNIIIYMHPSSMNCPIAINGDTMVPRILVADPDMSKA